MTRLENTLTTLTSAYAADQGARELEAAECSFLAYLSAVESPHYPRCHALLNGTAEACTCSRARWIAEAEQDYRTSRERIASLGLRFFSSNRVDGELRG